MHLGNGAVTPECGLVALGVAAAGVGMATLAARSFGIDRDRARTAGALGAAVFAAQLFNVPIVPFCSVHLIGGVLLAWVLGPALGAITMACILSLQAVLLGDGGLLALGCNIINMGLLPAAVVALAKGTVRGESDYSQKTAADAREAWKLAASAFACTVGAVGLIVLEVSIGRGAEELEGLGAFASQMVLWHLLAGVLEAVASVAIVASLARWAKRDAAEFQLSARGTAWVTTASLLIAVLPALGFTSSVPDGYRAALASAEQAGLAVGQIDSTAQLAGVSATLQAWQDGIAAAFPGPEAVLVVLATALAGLAAWGWARVSSPTVWSSIH